MAGAEGGTQDVTEQFRRSDKDTGSPEVQIALITKRLETLSKHFEKFPKDNLSRRGLFKLVWQRKKLLDYLKREDFEKYRTVLNSLGLRK